jgi:phytoene/squalene synthetase
LEDAERSIYLAEEARARDPDRYLCALFSPAARRDALLGLILFHHELARIPEIVTQPVAGMIRYQWWREAIDEIGAGKPPRQHPVVIALALAIGRGWVDPAALQALIDAREPRVAQAPESDPAELEGFVAATSGSLQTLTYAALGGLDPVAAAAACEIGTAFGLVGIIQAVAHEMQGRPKSANDAAEGVVGLIGDLAARSDARLRRGRQQAGRPPRDQMAAFLPAPLTQAFLLQLRRIANDPHRTIELARPSAAPAGLLARMLLRRP